MDTEMTQVVSEVSMCPHVEVEAQFIGAIDFSLLRDAVLHGMSARELLDILIRSMDGGYLSVHLSRVPSSCKERMIKQLEKRMQLVRQVGDACLSWKELLKLAAFRSFQEEYRGHAKSCPFCQRDIRQLRGKLPFLKEFEEFDE